MVHLTSSKLEVRGMQPTDGGEVLKWVGVTLLATRYEFGARADLRATRARSMFMLAPAFGERTGMSRRRFDALWSCMTFSQQTGGADDASEKRRWQLINDFIASINDHRASRVSPSDLICVDESMCQWYGQGGHCVLRGLPMYVAIDGKPENGCEIQNAASGRSGIMLRPSVVTTVEHRNEKATGEEGNFPYGTAVLKMVAPWAGTKRGVCADSYFASVTATQQLLGMGLRFIGVVKIGTEGFLFGALSVLPLEERGEHVIYVHAPADGVTDTMAVLWVDWERRYFISSASSTLPGTPYNRVRRRQVGDDAERVVLTAA